MLNFGSVNILLHFILERKRGDLLKTHCPPNPFGDLVEILQPPGGAMPGSPWLVIPTLPVAKIE